MEIKIYRFNLFEKESNVKAFVDLLVDDEVIIKGFKVIEGSEGLFLANPSKKGREDKYFNTVRFVTKEKKEEIQKMVIERYNVEKGE